MAHVIPTEVLNDHILGYLPASVSQRVRRVDPPPGHRRTLDYNKYCEQYVDRYRYYTVVLDMAVWFMTENPEPPANQEGYPDYHLKEVKLDYLLENNPIAQGLSTRKRRDALKKYATDSRKLVNDVLGRDVREESVCVMTIQQVQDIQRRELEYAEPLRLLRNLMENLEIREEDYWNYYY